MILTEHWRRDSTFSKLSNSQPAKTLRSHSC
uniref:Uncharacterized protein n=1 Tax=Arundo donax TaxID=35708 RepID=A0A0A9CMZ5_ARUDO